MTGSKDLVVDVHKIPSMPTNVEWGDASSSKVLGLGKVVISQDLTIEKVMLVESLAFNLMSVSMLCDLDIVVVFGKFRCLVLMESDNSKVFEGFRKGDLYIVDFFAGP